MSECVFCKIVKKEIPAEIYFEDEQTIAFKNINPEAVFHALVIPKEHLVFNNLDSNAENILGHLLLVAKKVAEAQGLANGYRLVINNGPDAGQEIEHLHVHILGGEKLGPL